MSNYNIYLIDPFNKVPIVSVADILYQWFNPIAKKAGFSRAYICSPQYVVQPKQHELLIYICPLGTSVVQNMQGAQKSSWPHPTTSSTLGVTVFNRITGAEVWAKFHDADAFASLIFHEAMHNKLQLDDRLHRKFNPSRLSSSPITWPTLPSRPEVDAMVAALRNPTPQWPDGQQILRDAATRFNHGDSMWNNQIVF